MKRILLFVCFSICFVRCTVTNNRNDENVQMLDLMYKDQKLKNELLQGAMIATVELNNTTIPDLFSFIVSSGDTILLKDYLSDTKALILYTGSSFCSSCFRDELSILSNFSSKIKTKKILVLVQNMKLRQMIVEKKRHEYKFDIGIINNPSSYNLNLVKNDRPIYFTTNEKMKLSEVFVPFKKMKGFSDRYLQTISNKWQVVDED